MQRRLKPEREHELTKRLEVLKTTDMAVIVSSGQNEIAQMKKQGLDIEPHRRRMNESDPGLDEKFKDTEDPLRLVFVCAIWLTGFDAPSCSMLYLDEPMRNHTLMQTVARANRVFPGKHSGLIVDKGRYRPWSFGLESESVSARPASNKMNFKCRLSARKITAHLMSCLCIALSAATPASGAVPPSIPLPPLTEASLRGFHHTTFGLREGGVTDISALAQTPDGYLWIGSSTGLVRFDGARFDAILSEQLLSPAVTALMAEPTGDVWIGYLIGGISRLHEGKVTHFVPRPNPAARIRQFLRAPDGVLWAATRHGLLKFSREAWSSPPESMSSPNEAINWLGVSHDSLLLLTSSAGFSLQRGSTQFARVERRVVERVRYGLTHEQITVPEIPEKAQQNPSDTLLDRSGTLWFAHGHILTRWRAEAPANAADQDPDAFTDSEELPGFISVLLEDRESNIWVGSTRGLDRYSRARFHRLDLPVPVQNPLVVRGWEDQLWVGRDAGETLSVGMGAVPTPALGTSVWSTATAPDGALWALGNNGVMRYQKGHVTAVPVPIDTRTLKDVQSFAAFQAIAVDSQGAIWVSIAHDVGLFRWREGKWDRPSETLGLPAGPAIRLLTDTQGQLWLTYPDNRVARIVGDSVTVFTARDGLAVGNVLSIERHAGHTWVGGDRGVAAFIENRFVTLRGESNERFRVTSGLVEADDQDLWLNSARGVFHIPAREIERVLSGTTTEAKFELFDWRDGLDGGPEIVRPGPTLLRATDGRLWISRQNGVWWLDPQHIPRNAVAPIAIIQGVYADGSERPSAAAMVELNHSTQRLRIEFTGTSLTDPDRMGFRYRLTGVDSRWQDGGSRRVADYTNLSPGNYLFKIEAANADGVWTTRDATLRLHVLPAFYQTLWFRLLLLCAFLILVWVVFTIRLNQLQRRTRLESDARHAERERIARDLHDTLLGGTQALLFRLQTWVRDVGLPEMHREQVSDVVNQARRTVIEARDRIIALRRSEISPRHLVDVLEEIGVTESQRIEVQFRFSVLGRPRITTTQAHHHLSEIAREALRNAFTHANPACVGMTLKFTWHSLRLSVCDDGRGLDARTLEIGSKPSHFGLVGMRERAVQLHAHFTIAKNDVAGTCILVVVPAAIAYLHRFPLWWKRQQDRLDVDCS